MRLNDLGGNGGTSSGGSDRRYERITREDFESFLNSIEEELDITFLMSEDTKSRAVRELVYDSKDAIPHTEDDYLEPVVLRIYSSLDVRTGEAREKGSDAIRCVIFDTRRSVPIGGRKRTNRIKTWRKNLRKKIKSLVEEYQSYIQRCPDCQQGWMVEREGRYGKFYGCTSYPNCENTMQEI